MVLVSHVSKRAAGPLLSARHSKRTERASTDRLEEGLLDRSSIASRIRRMRKRTPFDPQRGNQDQDVRLQLCYDGSITTASERSSSCPRKAAISKPSRC